MCVPLSSAAAAGANKRTCAMTALHSRVHRSFAIFLHSSFTISLPGGSTTPAPPPPAPPPAPPIAPPQPPAPAAAPPATPRRKASATTARPAGQSPCPATSRRAAATITAVTAAAACVAAPPSAGTSANRSPVAAERPAICYESARTCHRSDRRELQDRETPSQSSCLIIGKSAWYEIDPARIRCQSVHSTDRIGGEIPGGLF